MGSNRGAVVRVEPVRVPVRGRGRRATVWMARRSGRSLARNGAEHHHLLHLLRDGVLRPGAGTLRFAVVPRVPRCRWDVAQRRRARRGGVVEPVAPGDRGRSSAPPRTSASSCSRRSRKSNPSRPTTGAGRCSSELLHWGWGYSRSRSCRNRRAGSRPAMRCRNHRPRPFRPATCFARRSLWVTLVGIILATTPVIGGWGTANWMTPWAEKAGSAALRADVLQTRGADGHRR